jgi:hypothetical protein
MPNPSHLLIALIVPVLAAQTHAHSHAANDVIIGKVVAVSDGTPSPFLKTESGAESAYRHRRPGKAPGFWEPSQAIYG